MSFCVMPASPINSEQNSFGQLSEESFDTTFQFLNPDLMDYYITSPEPNNGDNINMPRIIPSQTSPPTHLEEGTPRCYEVGMTHNEGDMSNLAIQSTPASQPGAAQLQSPFMYNQYTTPYHQGAHDHPNHFHPYRPYGPNGLRSPAFHLSPAEPLSPPLSLSPPGSSSSGQKHQSLLSTPPTAVSPAMVSPASALSDLSPHSISWTYPLPHVPGGSGLYTGAQLPQGPTSSGLSMIQGFPYPTSPLKPASSSRVMRPRITRRVTSSSTTIKKEKSDEGLFDSDDEEEDSNEGCLGLTPTDGADGRTTVPAKREEVRKARIESEQRRRDELREGFKRLKDALPASNQRSSKSSLLDRSVAHIQQIQSANHYLLNQLDAANAELAALRATNQELVHTVAMHSRASTGSSPGSNHGKP